MDAATRNKLMALDWVRIQSKLVLYAHNRLRRYGLGPKNKEGTFAGGRSGDDFAQAAIEALFTEQRVFKRGEPTEENVLSFLMDIVASQVNTTGTSASVRKNVPISDLELPSDEKQADDCLIRVHVEKILVGEPELQKAFRYILRGANRPQDLAACMGISIKDSRSILKKLRRKLKHMETQL